MGSGRAAVLLLTMACELCTGNPFSPSPFQEPFEVPCCPLSCTKAEVGTTAYLPPGLMPSSALTKSP